MNTRDQLNHYLSGLEKRLRWLTVSKGIAIALAVALFATLAIVWFTNALAFSNTSITIARVVLFLALAAALGFALILPLMRLNQRKTADRAESTFPEFNQRLLTYIERGETHGPMLDLLASDAVSVANKTEPERVAPRKNILAFRHRWRSRSRRSVDLADPGRARLLRIRIVDAMGRNSQRTQRRQFLRHHSRARQQARPPQSRSDDHRDLAGFPGSSGTPLCTL